MLFKDRNIILGLTGSIAIYKSASLLRQLKKEGAQVRVIMTESAQEFMSPTVFNTLSNKRVFTGMFAGRNKDTRHIKLKKWSDAILVAPATANIIAKTAAGLADDLLSTVLLTNHAKNMIFAPAMNTDMYENPITGENIHNLKNKGYGFVEPGAGELACGDTGKGRLANLDHIVEALHRKVNTQNQLKDKNVVVTAGPTYEYLDDIRYITNKSTGKMGYALANEAAKEGANVTLVSGPTDLETPYGIKQVNVETAQEMHQSLKNIDKQVDVLFMTAAVEDISPQRKKGKIKKDQLEDNIKINRAPDIVSSFRAENPETCIVGFSAEIEYGLERSQKKLEQKNLDYIVWNDPIKEETGFQADTNECVLISQKNEQIAIPKANKRKVAEQIISNIDVKNG